MTVISTVITRHCTAHASDSFLTEFGTGRVREAQQSKLVPVPAWRGVMGYWGLAWLDDGWNTYRWLCELVQRAGDYGSAAAFANGCAAALATELRRRRFLKPLDSGLGIHFTAYEYIDNY